MTTPIMELCGDTGSGDLKLKLTEDGKSEVSKRLNRMLDILSEVAVNDVKEPLRFLRGLDENAKRIVAGPVRAHIIGEMRGALDVLVRRNEEFVAMGAAELARQKLEDVSKVVVERELDRMTSEIDREITSVVDTE